MKKHNFLFASTAFALLAVLPFAASAHERRVYQIGAKNYTFVVGFLNEPANVDDKAGVDLLVMLGNGASTIGPDGDMDGPPLATKPVDGLDKTLKVEISAGSEKKVFDFAPAYGAPGHYRAIFYPSVATTYTFRIFGTIDNTAVDFSFPCNASGQAPEDDMHMMKMSDSVMQKVKSGQFGCPSPKTDEVFPVPKVTLADLDQQVQEVSAAAASYDVKSTVGMVFGALGLVVALGVWIRRGKGQ